MRRTMAALRQPMNLLAAHTGLYTLAGAVANGFVGAYLLRMGVALPLVLLVYGGFFAARFALRLLAVGVVRALGFRRALVAATALAALQYWPLAGAAHPRWLLAWLLCFAMSDAIYWPTLHAVSAVVGSHERRGQELGLRQGLASLASVLGPLVGGLAMARLGPAADFAIGGAIMLLGLPPLLLMPELEAGTVPRALDSFRGADGLGVRLFLIDGWMASSWTVMWPVLYFVLIGSRYEAFGLANAAAGGVGFLVSLASGRWADRHGGGDRRLAWVASALVASIALRTAASWSPLAGDLANLGNAALGGLYFPLLMSVLYRRAHGTGDAFRFHLAIEGAWDAAALATHLVGAAIVWALPRAYTMSMLPSVLGVLAFVACMRREAAGRAAGS